jgi:hypothetical protein
MRTERRRKREVTPTGPQRLDAVRLDPIDYVRTGDFRAGYADRCAGRPPNSFARWWEYYIGRQVANALFARGIDPRLVSQQDQAVWLKRLERDGTLPPL